MRFMEVLTRLVVGMGRFGDHLLKKKFSGGVVAALAFASGAALVYALRPKPAPRAEPAAPPPVVAAAAPAAPPCETAATPTPDPADYYREMMRTPELQKWKNSHSGAPLPIDFDLGGDWGMLYEARVVGVPMGRLLVAEGVTLYMFDVNRRVLWKYELPQPVIDLAYVEATGTVCGTAGDNNMFILDAATGRVLVNNSRNGRAGYGAVLKYGDDVCLIADAFGDYNADYSGGAAPMQDGVTAWRGSRMLWRSGVPPDAELQVVGEKIYAVTKTSTRILVKEIKVPKGNR